MNWFDEILEQAKASVEAKGLPREQYIEAVTKPLAVVAVGFKDDPQYHSWTLHGLPLGPVRFAGWPPSERDAPQAYAIARERFQEAGMTFDRLEVWDALMLYGAPLLPPPDEPFILSAGRAA